MINYIKHLVQTVPCDNFNYVLCGSSSTSDYPVNDMIWVVYILNDMIWVVYIYIYIYLHCILYIIYCILYIVYCILHIVYCILYMFAFTCNHPDSGVFGDVVVPETSHLAIPG